LVPVRRFNERCIDLLSDVAGNDAVELRMLKEHTALWVALDRAARERLARTAIVLVDVQFSRDDWWREVVKSAEAQTQSGVPSNGLPIAVSEELMYETLMFCWQMAGANRAVALTSFAMSPAVADTIAALTPREVRHIAARHHASIQIRWANDVWLWQELLQAALRADDEELAVLHLHGKLILFGALGRPTG
jgi:hypothetical protein